MIPVNLILPSLGSSESIIQPQEGCKVHAAVAVFAFLSMFVGDASAVSASPRVRGFHNWVEWWLFE